MNILSGLKNKLIGDKNFYRRVIAVVIPIIIQSTVTNVVNLVDNVMIGNVDTLQMTAVGIINQLIFVFNLCIFGGMSGAGIFAAQFFGAKDNKGVAHCFRFKLYLGFIILAIFVTVFLAFPEYFISLYIAEGTDTQNALLTLGYAKDYLFIMLLGLIPFMVAQAYGSTLKEVGETSVPMIGSVAAIGVNIFLNYMLIFGKFGFPALGVVGAAIATSISRLVECLFVIFVTHKKKEKYLFIKDAFTTFKIPKYIVVDIIKKGTPILINELLWSMGMAALLQCYSVRGIHVVGANTISSTVSNLFNVVFIALGSSIAIFVGQQLGANKIKEAKLTASRLIFLSFASSIVMGLVLMLLSPYIPYMYNTENNVKELATSLLFIYSIFMPFFALSNGSYFTLRSGGKTIITFLFDSIFTWCICVPTAYLLVHFTGLNILAVYAIVQGIEIIKGCVGLILIKKGVWINNIVNNKL
ncbi:MAG: MATE family efflux transporter [Ruminococcaceae bacterium]|nr:MATE family efflux transporter [Oscillospiraceae bacterium]